MFAFLSVRIQDQPILPTCPTKGSARWSIPLSELAKITSEDPFAGLPDASELGKVDHDLELYSDSVVELSACAAKIEWAKQAEAAALGG